MSPREQEQPAGPSRLVQVTRVPLGLSSEGPSPVPSSREPPRLRCTSLLLPGGSGSGEVAAHRVPRASWRPRTRCKPSSRPLRTWWEGTQAPSTETVAINSEADTGSKDPVTSVRALDLYCQIQPESPDEVGLILPISQVGSRDTVPRLSRPLSSQQRLFQPSLAGDCEGLLLWPHGA